MYMYIYIYITIAKVETKRARSDKLGVGGREPRSRPV